jgi:hypothetical protein
MAWAVTTIPDQLKLSMRGVKALRRSGIPPSGPMGRLAGGRLISGTDLITSPGRRPVGLTLVKVLVEEVSRATGRIMLELGDMWHDRAPLRRRLVKFRTRRSGNVAAHPVGGMTGRFYGDIKG